MPTTSRVERAVNAGLAEAAADQRTKMSGEDIPTASQRVMDELEPTLMNLANQEPWYRSRVTIGAIISISVPILGAFGIATDWIDLEQATTIGIAIGTAFGGMLTLYGRWKARKPIGS
jgi:hypothetical protein